MTAPGKGLGVSITTLDDHLSIYSAEDAEVLHWWFVTAKDNSWSMTDLAKRSGVSSASLSRLFRGVYEADVSKMISKLIYARANFDEVAENPDFIMTSLAKRMFAALDKCRALRNVSIFWGPMGIGKTTIMQQYNQLHGNGLTHYFRCPGYGTTFCQFTYELAESLRISISGKSAKKIRAEIKKLLWKSNVLLIIDELHEPFITCDRRNIIRIFEWLRELQGDEQFGLALFGTTDLKEHFFEGPHAAVLEQLTDRGTIQIPLPGKPTKGDVVAFLKHYGLSFPADSSEELQLLNDILAGHGLRKLTLHLRDGLAFANKQEEPYAWHHFVAAHKAIQSLAKVKA